MYGRKRRLNIFNWENYVAANTIRDFEREFDCRVRYATYGNAEEMLAKVISGNSGWDIVFPSNIYVPPMQELGLLATLDHSLLPNIGNLARNFKAPEWDTKLELCIPYMFSATGIVYAKSVARTPLAWADLWTDLYQRRVTMLDDSAEMFAACLKQMGRSVNSGNPEDLRKARDLAMKQKPLLRAYLNEEVRDQVVAGDVLVAQMWAQVAQVAMENSGSLAFSFPSEGFPLYADNMAILRESKRQDLAHAFVNYMLRPSVAAQVCKEMRTATANQAARDIMPESDRNNLVLYPDTATLQRGEWFRALPGDVQRLRDRYWTEIKST
jgi:spermidine/putrescine transport system substrate-binding protein